MNHGLAPALRCNKYSSRDSFCQNSNTRHFLLLSFLLNFSTVAVEFWHANCLRATAAPLLARLPAITLPWTGASIFTSISVSPKTFATRVSTPLCEDSQSVPCLNVHCAPSLQLTLQGSAGRDISHCGRRGNIRLFSRRLQSECLYTSLRHACRLLPPVDGCTLLVFSLKVAVTGATALAQNHKVSLSHSHVPFKRIPHCTRGK